MGGLNRSHTNRKKEEMQNVRLIKEYTKSNPGQSVKEIAFALNLTANTVYKHLRFLETIEIPKIRRQNEI